MNGISQMSCRKMLPKWWQLGKSSWSITCHQ